MSSLVLRIQVIAPPRADQLALWIQLTEEKQEAERVKWEEQERTAEEDGPNRQSREISGQVGPKPQGGRPESGISAASHELHIPETTAKRAVKIASTTPETKKAAKDAGLDTLLSTPGKEKARAEARAFRMVSKMSS